MVHRTWWIEKLRKLWKRRSIIWLAGVRRVGKTTLCQLFDNMNYFDCELPRVRRQLEDPEAFLDQNRGPLVLDEIHRLEQPSELLKIAADHYSQTKIIATGSSTLGASKKFKDTLTGRKESFWLTPMTMNDLESFGCQSIEHRLFRGGLPPFFLAKQYPETYFQEWMDSFWAKDIQELFNLERRNSFMKFFELLMVQSGGVFEASSFAAPCGVSHTTIRNYLGALEETFAMHVIRPFHSRRAKEIVAAPKVYGFDTGFVCYYRGWQQLRRNDFGELWEHLVLNELHAHLQHRQIHYWRTKRGQEIDFVLTNRQQQAMAIECKWQAQSFNPKNLQLFRAEYPNGPNYVVAHDVHQAYRKRYGQIEVQFMGLQDLSSIRS